MKAIVKIIADISRPFRKYFERKYIEKIELNNISQIKARSIMRHEAHRIEKAYYNDVFEKGKKIYLEKAHRIIKINDEQLKNTKVEASDDVQWSLHIAKNATKLAEEFIDFSNQKLKQNASEDNFQRFKEVMLRRRSNRVWSTEQPTVTEYRKLAKELIEIAVCMPCSGNRQATRYLILATKEEKDNLRGLKEKHTYEAPLVILVFSDESLYGSYGTFGKGEECTLIDAAGATAALLIAAEVKGYSTCWNHFGSDLVASRKTNKIAFKKLKQKHKLPESFRPIAALAIGIESFNPPIPSRMALKEFIVN